MLNNWHGAEVDANGVFTDEAKASVEERMEQIQVELPKDAERPRMGPLTKQYLSNRDHCVAQDQALQSVTSCLGLVHFQADRVPGREGPNEHRFKVPFDELPPEVQEVSQGMDFRWAVLELTTNDTFSEVDWGDIATFAMELYRRRERSVGTETETVLQVQSQR